MIKEEIDNLLNDYNKWLKDRTILKQIDSNWVEITTPYLDRHNDCLQIYARKFNDGYELTDDGYIITDLLNSGCSLDKPKRQDLLKTTLAGFGVQLNKDQLCIRTTQDNFPLKKHNILQAMLAVNDLFYLSSPYVASLFMEDVTDWLNLSEIRYTPKVKFTGKSGYDHLFDFVIPKSRIKSERIIQTLSNPKKANAEALVFKWIDSRETRPPDSSLYVFLNNNDDNTSPEVIEAFKNYALKPILWSDREQIKEELSA
ncbi:MAG: DUF1829 domain-containing protein [Elusimicrobiota bacterium]|jgi:hypothetical protein|nr:DUF1829 domain-containing protein [Elusimicrobiota bacterium]